MLSDKELPGHLRPNPRPVSRRDRGVDRPPIAALRAATRWATSTRNGVASSMILNGAPNRMTSRSPVQ